MATLDYFTATCNGIGAIQVDYVDAGVAPDEEIVFAFVDFIPREDPGTVHWLSGLTPPRGIQLDTIRGRFSDQDGKLRTIIGHPTNEKQIITATSTPITVTYSGQTTAPFANTATPAQVQAALEALSNINVGDIYVYGVMRNEKQTISVTGGATAGYFLLTFNGETTVPISRNASASTIQAVLQALGTVGSDGCSVTGPTGGPWIVEFTGTLAGVDVPLMTSVPRNETQVVTITGTATAGQFQLTYSGQTTADIAYNSSAATVQAALEALSNLAPGDIVVTGNAGGPYTIAFAGTKAASDQPLITVVAERNERQTVTIGGAPTAGTFSLTFNGQTCTGIPRNASASTLRTMMETALSNINPGDLVVQGNAGGPWTVTFQGQYAQLNVPQMTAASALTPSGTVTVATLIEGLGVTGGTVTTATTVEAIFLTPSGGITIVSTVTGSQGTPWTVEFIGPLQGTDVAQMTATNATVATGVAGTGDLGVQLVANTAVMELGTQDLIYDVVITVPDLDPLKVDRKINPFAIAAPKTANAVVDLATVAKLPPKPISWD